MIALARSPVRRMTLVVQADLAAVGGVGEQEPDLLERLADGAHPMAESGVRRRLETEGARGARSVEATAPRCSAVRRVVGFDAATWKDEVPGGESTRAVPADQENLEGAGGTIAKHDDGGSRDRRHRRRFDGHGVV